MTTAQSAFYTGPALSNNNNSWETPQAMFDDLERRFGPFDLDPCATPANAKCERFYTREEDGLTKPWHGRVFMNPPYSRRNIGRWMARAWDAVQSGEADIVVALVPSRTDTAWWHDYAMSGEIEFIRGRVKYGNGKRNAPFASAIVVFRRGRNRE